MSHSVRNNLKARSFAGVFPLIPVVCILLAASPARSQDTITTLAGNGATMYSGDGTAAITAALNHPRGVAVDSAGMIYIADVDNYRVRRVTPAGIISTIAGTGVFGFSGDRGPAAVASFSDVTGLALDPAGNLYIADASNRRIRKVTPAGIVTTVAGTGAQGFSGDGGPATAATLNRPTSVIVDPDGGLYFSDSSNQRIRRIAADGTITTIAGNGIDGFSGDGGLATAASMSFPLGVAKDHAGNVYFTDGNNNRVRMVTPAGIISTVAGGGSGRFGGDGGPATSASLDIPSDIAFDLAGNLYIADSGNNRVRRVDPSGIITTITGDGNDGYSGDGGPAADAELSFPWGVTADTAGVIYIGDRVNSRVRIISAPPLAAPALQDGTALNGASLAPNFAIAPGAIVTIFGSNFAAGPTAVYAPPYSTVIGQTSVTFNGIAAPLFYVSSGQINAQAPFELGLGNALLQVHRGAAVSPVGNVNVAYASPGIFIMDQVTGQGAILHLDYTLVSSANPARPGEYVSIYCTGLGAVSVPVSSGQVGPGAFPYANTLVTPTVIVGGLKAVVSFSGLAPDLVGMYAINLVVPDGLPAGNQPIQIMVGPVASNLATMAVTR